MAKINKYKQGVVDRLFIGGNWHYNACLNFTENRDYGYIEGYRKGADILVSYIKNITRDQDYLVYPVIFLYRHGVELRLKSIIRIGSTLLNREMENLRNHNLEELWNKSETILIQIEPECRKELLPIKKVILALDDLDPTGEAYRYSKSNDGSITIGPSQKQINLATFSEEITKIYLFLDGVYVKISYLMQQKFENLHKTI